MENEEYSKLIFISKVAQDNFNKSTDEEKIRLADFLAKSYWEVRLKIIDELNNGN